MPTIYEQIEGFKKQLLQRERKAASEMVRTYGKAYQRLRRELDKLTNQIAQAAANGEEINQFWLLRQERYTSLLNQVARELGRFAQSASKQVNKQQQEAIRQALGDSTALVQAIANDAQISVSFNRLPVSAVENLAGALSDGSPLNSLLAELGTKGRDKVAEALIEGITLGRNPRAIAKEFKDALGGQLDRALRIARTETTRVYRTASLENYRANSSVVRGWQWVASRSPRTCLNCLSRDGSVWLLTEPMPAHVNCRCVFIPVLRDVETAKRQTGTEWFEAQSAETKQGMMSKAAYNAYIQGRVSLSDFEGEKYDPRWGKSTYERSLKEVLR